MKKGYISLLVILGNLLSAQSKVGINTSSPSYDLDVNGTMAIRQLPSVTNDQIHPLGVSNTTHQIVKLKTNDYSPFSMVTYKFRLQTPDEDWLNDADLKIPVDKYVVVLVGYSLVDESDASGILLSALPVDKIDGVSDAHRYDYEYSLFNGQQDSDRGRVMVYNKRGNNGQPSQAPYTGFFAIGAEQVFVYPSKDTNTWKIYADYPSAKGVNYTYSNPPTRNLVRELKTNTKYTWVTNLMIIDRSFVNNKEVSISLKDNSNTEIKKWKVSSFNQKTSNYVETLGNDKIPVVLN